MKTMLDWLPPTVLPEKGDHIIIKFYNDLGLFHAAGIVCETSDTKEHVVNNESNYVGQKER